MSRIAFLGIGLAALVAAGFTPVAADDAPAAELTVKQSAAPAAADTAAAPDLAAKQSAPPDAAHDHSSTCGGDGKCCAACQVRQKYSKAAAAEDAEGGCPCQRAKRAREQAQQQSD